MKFNIAGAFIAFVLICGLTLSGCVFAWQREGRHGWGPFTGTVLDAETGEPIAGAQVYVNVHYQCIVGDVLIGMVSWEDGAPGQDFDTYTQTDADGKYHVRKRFALRPWCGTHGTYTVTIYKRGYAAYSGHLYYQGPEARCYGGDEQDFKVKNNIARLEKWDEKKFSKRDHHKHVGFMGEALFCAVRKKARGFCIEAREEMILACMYRYKSYVKKRKGCEESVDFKIGIENLEE